MNGDWSNGGAKLDSRALGGQLPHDAVEPGLPLEADAGPRGQVESAVLQPGVVGEARERAEYAGIRFRAAQPEAAGDVQRHLVAAVRP